MSERDAIARASFGRRAAARAIDAFVTAVLAAVMALVGSVPAGFISLALGVGPQFMGSSADPRAELVAGLLLLVVVAAVVAVVVRYEVVQTARTGQTLGKRTMGIAVERFSSPRGPRSVVPGLVRGRYWSRWALPHLSGLVAASVGAGVSVGALGAYGLLVGAGTGLAGWMLVYASALWNKDRRGWHDKLACTVVTVAAAPHDDYLNGGPDTDTCTRERGDTTAGCETQSRPP